jgi:hypothetical protein
MVRSTSALGLLIGCIATANAQFPQTNPGIQPGQQQPQQQGQTFQPGPFDQFGQFPSQNNFMPNIYNPQTQPLSPYLYGVRGSNPAVDYYFGTRPGTVGGGGRGMGGAPFMATGGYRPMFFPQLANAPEPFAQAGVTSPNSVLPPAGHPVVFSNTLGFFPSPFGQAGGRSGLAGLGGVGQKK